MTTAISLARRVAKSLPGHILRSEFNDSDSLANDLISHLLFEDDLPDDLVSLLRKRLLRRLSTIRRNLQRRHVRTRSFRADCPSRARSLGTKDHLALRDLFKKATCSTFDKQAIAADTRKHPKYADFAEFAASSNAGCTRGEAYKRRQELHGRIR